MLSDEEIELLGEWKKHWAYAKIAEYLGVDRYETVSRWHHRKHGVTRALYNSVVGALHRKPWLSGEGMVDSSGLAVRDLRNTPQGAAPERLRSVYEAGRQLHYDRFQPDAAMYVLAPIASDPALVLLPPHEALNMMAVTMAIFRQSLHSSEGDFLVRGHLCLNLLAGLHGRVFTEDLTATICTVAWELIAVTVQRGWAMESVPWLNRIEDIVSRRRLRRHLQPGRERSMARLMHWARVVAHRDFDAVQRYVNRDGGSIAVYAQCQTEAPQYETHNIVVQQMSERLRFSLERKADERSLKLTADYFDEKVCPIIKDLDQSSQDLFASNPLEQPVSAKYTPSTAMGMVFLYLAAALHLERSGINDDIARAHELARRIQTISDGAILMQQFNGATQQFIKLARAKQEVRAEVLEHFPFVSNISPPGLRKLHAMAGQLLDIVEQTRGSV
jgi:hypothetical protein